jgi:hypothetical protein
MRGYNRENVIGMILAHVSATAVSEDTVGLLIRVFFQLGADELHTLSMTTDRLSD